MHLKAKRAAFGGLLLAMTVIFMFLGSVIETNTLFLLAAASFCGCRIQRVRSDDWTCFFIFQQCCLGFFWHRINSMLLLLPEWDFYIWGREFIWKILERSAGVKRKMQWYRLAKVILLTDSICH